MLKLYKVLLYDVLLYTACVTVFGSTAGYTMPAYELLYAMLLYAACVTVFGSTAGYTMPTSELFYAVLLYAVCVSMFGPAAAGDTALGLVYTVLKPDHTVLLCYTVLGLDYLLATRSAQVSVAA